MPKPVLLLLTVLTFCFAAQSQWSWINPKPSGATSFKILFTDNRNGFIFNSNAELIRTRNTGADWQIVDSFPGMTCFDIKGNTGVMGGWGSSFYISRDKGDTWQLRSSGLSGNFRHISMVSDDVFFFYGGDDNKIFKTLDGGDTWQTLSCDGRIDQVFFATQDTGYVAILDDILKTVDGGTTWKSTNKTNTSPANITSMFFLNENVGYAYREFSKMLSTTDGGETWQTVDLIDRINSIYFTDLDTGYAGGEHGVLYRTTDKGRSWQWIGVSARIAGYDINSVYFLSGTMGFAVGQRGRILRTTNGGNSWQPYALTYNNIVSLEFPSKNTGYAVTGREIYKTLDRGATWQMVSNFEIQDYSSFSKSHFVNQSTGFVTADQYAKVFRTSDGGSTWKQISPTGSSYEGVTDLDFLTPELGYMVLKSGSGGSLIVKTTNGGETWEDIWRSQYMGETFSRIDYVSETTAYAIRYQALYKTTDNSQTWQKIFELDYGSLNDVYFLNSQKGFICGDQGIMYITTDGGGNWKPIDHNWSEVYPYDIKEVKFFNEDIGYLRMGDGGTLFKTIDGGLSWNKDGNYGGNVISFAEDSAIYVAGGNGIIIAGSVKAAGLFSFEHVVNNRCTASFSIKEKRNVPAVNSIFLEIKDVFGNIRAINMVKDAAGGSDVENVYAATVTGLSGGQVYTARVRYDFENVIHYFGNIGFTAKGFDQPFISIDNNGITLSSSINAPGEWYLNEKLVPGISTPQIQPAENGYYSTRVNDDGCISAMSPRVLYVRDNLGVAIYPNPAINYITITNSRQRQLDIKIFDINGVSKLSTTITQFSQNIQLQQFPSGVYTIWISDRETNESVKLRFLKH